MSNNELANLLALAVVPASDLSDDVRIEDEDFDDEVTSLDFN